jgi:hypothetical protein
MTELWYRFNLFGEKQFFETNLVDGMVVPAHLVAYYEIAIPEMLQEVELPFLIDPVTYVWNIHRHYICKEGELKKSYLKLVEKLDCKIAQLLGKRRIQNIATHSLAFREFIDSVLSFQLLEEKGKKPARRSSIERIKRYRNEVEPKKIRPYALIPPYFYFTKVSDDLYEKTLYAAEFAKASNYAETNRIYPCLCIDRSLLSREDQLDAIINDFKDYEGIILWVSNFDEIEASLDELDNFANFVSCFNKEDTEVINFYGGYFSLLLNNIGLSKLSCGICYSRFRNVLSQAGGGGLPLRYYEPNLKVKLLADDMIRLYSTLPELFICDCPICSEYFESFQKAKTRNDKEQLLNNFFGIYRGRNILKNGVIDWEKSRYHFLHSRKKEQKEIESKNIQQVISNLEAKYKLLKKKRLDLTAYRKPSSLEYLEFWAKSVKANS